MKEEANCLICEHHATCKAKAFWFDNKPTECEKFGRAKTCENCYANEYCVVYKDILHYNETREKPMPFDHKCSQWKPIPNDTTEDF